MDEPNTITELQRQLAAERDTRQRYQTLFQRMGQGYCEFELIRDDQGRAVDHRYIEFNPAFERIFGIPVARAKGRTATEVFPGLEPWWHDTFAKIAAGGEPRRIEHAIASLGRWFEVLVYPSGGDRLTTLYEDVTTRRHAQDALRASESRFTQFAEASPGGLWIRDAETLAMDYASRAFRSIFGLDARNRLDDVETWAATIVPEDRPGALQHLMAARRGEARVHEFRIRRPSDGLFRWIRTTDFPLYDHGQVTRIGGIAEDVTEARLAVQHQDVLLAELQHRVRNIMGLIRALANRTATGLQSAEEYRVMLEGRLLALSRVQALLTREANAGGPLRSIIESEIVAQAHHGCQHHLSGPDIRLAPKAVEVLTLAFHELATNALKYGALSVPEGRLDVVWRRIERNGRPWLDLEWIERGGPACGPASHRGFGSELIEARIPYELNGHGAIAIGPDGARCHLSFPLQQAESILETDAPPPATTFGGTLDMTGAPDLSGRTVLVVEDDYYMATDTAAALRGARATVLGPCPTEEAVRELLASDRPTHAVLDLNLGGGGPRFEVARLLQALDVPFVFLTGYDLDVIPADLLHVARLHKPVAFRAIVEAVSRL